MAPDYTRSRELHRRASGLMPGGVSSPVRAYKAVGRDPIYVRSGAGPYVTDVDGNRFIDYVGSYGPLILGHAHPAVLAAVADALQRGTSFGMPTEAEAKLAEIIIDAVPSVELVRFVNSGTEAVMSAIRVARAFANRPKIIKCTGCYHGHSDALLVQAGSGATTLGTPSSPGVPQAVTEHTLLVPYNDLSAMRVVLEKHPRQVAAVLIEPVAGNMGCVPPAEGYLQGLRALCDEHEALLIFDEVMTGFRVAWGGAQSLFGVIPDLTCLGKIVGGGLPCAAYGGREEIMRKVSPDGPVYQAGTLSGNPLAMAAAIAMLTQLREPGNYDRLEATSAKLADGLTAAAQAANVPVQVARVGSMLTPFFCDRRVHDYESALACRTDRFAAFFQAMLDGGVVLPPSQFEAWFVSTAHDEETTRLTLAAAEKAFAAAAAVV